MFHLRFGLSDHLKALLDFVFGSRRRVKKVRIFRAWFSQFLRFIREKISFSSEVNDSSKSYVFLHEMRFGIGFGIGFGMDSE